MPSFPPAPMSPLALFALSSLFISLFFLLPSPSLPLTTDGLSLLAFKSAISLDPTRSLSTWSDADPTPCSWTGVTCSPSGRVTLLSLPNLALNGYLPSELALLTSLLSLHLPSNNLSGPIPSSLSSLTSLSSLDLSHNSLSGPIPPDLSSLHSLLHLDLSSNSLSGPLPPSLASLPNLSGVLNLSCNSLSGRIPAAFGNLPVTVSLDLRQNNLSGEIPQTGSLLNQGPTAFAGNPELCGFPLKNPCQISGPQIPLANPTPDLSFPSPHPAESAGVPTKKKRSLAVPVLSVVLALAFVAIMVLQWQFRRKRQGGDGDSSGMQVKDSKGKREEEERRDGHNGGEIFVAVDEGFGLELEELLRASAYVVGKSRSGIIYRVVVGRGGAAVAVRRLSEAEDGGENAWKRRRDFESEAMAIGRARHPNVVSLRAYYYAPDEKLLVYDYVPNGSLHAALHGPRGPSAPPLDWEARLKISQGAARGLAYLHEYSPRKHAHGGLKSSKILLDEDLHPYVSGFGLSRLSGANRKITNSGASGVPSSSNAAYIAPELRGGGTTQKGDVYAFGVVLLEVLTGRGPEGLEGYVRRAFREERPMSEIVDPVLLHEVHAKKQVVAAFHVALGCTEAEAETRPRMRAVSESLDRIGSGAQ